MPKAWVISVNGTETETVNGRKKISYVDDYICDIYRDLLLQSGQQDQYDKSTVLKAITHPSGTHVVLSLAPHTITAHLKEVSVSPNDLLA